MTAEHRTVSRIVGILEAVAGVDTPVSLAALTTMVNAPKSSLHAIIGGLVHTGYLLDVGHGYTLGSGVHSLLGPTGTTLPLLLGEVCEEIANRTGETVTVAVRVGDSSVVYVHSEPSAFEVCYAPRLRQRRPILPTSSGKLFMAAGSGSDEELVFSRFGRAVVGKFLSEAPHIAASGLAFNRGETVSDVGAVAAGVYERSRLEAAITVAGPISRVSSRLEEFGELALDVLDGGGLGRSC